MWYFADTSHINRRKFKENCHKQPLAYFSGFWSLITLLFLSTVPAYAEWVAVEKDYLLPGLQTVYVDPDTIHREGNLVTMWQLINFKWMQGNGRGAHRFLSTKTHKEFDCAEKRLRLLAFTEFSRRMATGIPADGYVDKGNWVAVEPNSINQALWEVACGQEMSRSHTQPSTLARLRNERPTPRHEGMSLEEATVETWRDCRHHVNPGGDDALSRRLLCGKCL